MTYDREHILNYLFIYLSLAVLGLHCCMDFSLVAELGPLFIAAWSLLIVVASPVAKQRLRGAGASEVVACGIFPDQGSNPCLLHWQVDSFPWSHEGSPGVSFFLFIVHLCIFFGEVFSSHLSAAQEKAGPSGFCCVKSANAKLLHEENWRHYLGEIGLRGLQSLIIWINTDLTSGLQDFSVSWAIFW